MRHPPPARFWRWGEPVAPLARLLARGGVLAIPTESSYGLAAHPGIPAGVAAVYRIKARDAGKPLPVVVSDLAQLRSLGIDPDLPILSRLGGFWPGPLTIVLPLARPLPAAAGTGSLAVRVPGHERLRGLLAALGTGVTATSANKSGGEPVLDPQEAALLLAGEDAVVIDDGRLPGGAPSTLVGIGSAGELVVLRPGRIPAERLGEVAGDGTYDVSPRGSEGRL